MNKNSFKCHFCDVCDGDGCIGELPGMGGFSDNTNFKLNCSAWKELSLFCDSEESSSLASIRLGPMTGAVENIGYENEERFYFDIIDACAETGIGLSIGDGCPDIKLQSGIDAIRNRQKKQPDARASVFIKPYSNSQIFERIEWAEDVAESVGIDIDSYNILTMRNLVKLEQKTAKQLLEIKKHLKIPFAIKGIFNPEEIELVAEVKPDIIIISNHGGRVENRIGSTAEFLKGYGKELKKYCDVLCVDGGIRTYEDIKKASSYGAQEVMIGRPFATALCYNGKQGIKDFVKNLLP